MMQKTDYLAHHGIPGQKWGIRRYQNEDGTLTAEGRLRYLKQMTNDELIAYSKLSRGSKKHVDNQVGSGKSITEALKSGEEREKRKKIAIVAGTSLLMTFAALKYRKIVKAKAYTGVLKSFMKSSDKSIFSKSGREALKISMEQAGASTRTFKDAYAINKRFKAAGINIGRKEANRIYSSRRFMGKMVSKIKDDGSPKSMEQSYRLYKILTR